MAIFCCFATWDYDTEILSKIESMFHAIDASVLVDFMVSFSYLCSSCFVDMYSADDLYGVTNHFLFLLFGSSFDCYNEGVIELKCLVWPKTFS